MSSDGLSPMAASARSLNDALQITGASLVQISAKYLTPGGPAPLLVAIDLAPVQWTRRDEQVQGVFQIRVMVRRALSEGACEDFVEIEVAYQCVYKLLRDLSETDLASIPCYLATVGWAHAWPYLRTEVHGLSSKLGLPPVMLPVLLPGQAEQVPVVAANQTSAESASEQPKVSGP